MARTRQTLGYFFLRVVVDGSSIVIADSFVANVKLS
jgi:hypothetical protein